MLLGKRIVEDLDEFEEIETVDKALNIAELIRHIIALAVVHQSQTTHISLQLKVDRIRSHRQCFF